MKFFFKELEIHLAMVFISVTVSLVIINVFIRYFFSSIQFAWLNEVSVGCFTWAVFLGTSGTYRKRELIGVEAFVLFLPPFFRKVLKIITDIFVIVLLAVMSYLSFDYVYNSEKITAVLNVSYRYIDSSMVISFALMCLYSIKFLILDLHSFKDLNDDGLNHEPIVGGL